MGDDFRERFFTPFVLPLTVIGVMLLFGMSLSRVLLAVSELGAAFVALLAAGYIMAMAFFVESRKRITARSLGVALAIGLFGLIGAGAVASAAGMRELEHSSGEGEEAEAGEAAGGEVAANAPVFVAVDIAYESAPEELPAGEAVEVELVNEGAVLHNVVIEERGDELLLEAQGGETDRTSVTFEAGDYTYYCDVPGHRAAGMEGTLTVAEGVEVGAGGGGASPGASAEPTQDASGGVGTSSEPVSEGSTEG